MENMRCKLYVGPVCDYVNDCCLLLYITTVVTCHCFDVIALDNITCLYIIVCDRYNECSADFVRFFDDMTLK